MKTIQELYNIYVGYFKEKGWEYVSKSYDRIYIDKTVLTGGGVKKDKIWILVKTKLGVEFANMEEFKEFEPYTAFKRKNHFESYLFIRNENQLEKLLRLLEKYEDKLICPLDGNKFKEQLKKEKELKELKQKEKELKKQEKNNKKLNKTTKNENKKIEIETIDVSKVNKSEKKKRMNKLQNELLKGI